MMVLQPGAPSPSLTTKQQQAIVELLQSTDMVSVARKVGVNRTTLYRWTKQPHFVHALHEAEAVAVDELARMLVRIGRTAVTTLAKAMSDPATPAATRVRAADATLSRLLQLRELAALEQRITALEAVAGIEETSR
jgi:transposase-like protein